MDIFEDNMNEDPFGDLELVFSSQQEYNKTGGKQTYKGNKKDIKSNKKSNKKGGTIFREYNIDGNAPYMQYNPSTQTFSIIADVATLLGGQFFFFCNSDFYALFPSFPFLISPTSQKTGLINFNDLTSYVTGRRNITPGTPSESYDAVAANQEYSTLSLLSPVMSIVFTSNDIPVSPNNISDPLLFYQNRNASTGSVSGITNSIITDFTVDGIYNPSITYYPSSQYREVDLIGDAPLNSININVYWTNTLGQLIPFRLLSGATATVKMVFYK
jgi:hypothetical protein